MVEQLYLTTLQCIQRTKPRCSPLTVSQAANNSWPVMRAFEKNHFTTDPSNAQAEETIALMLTHNLAHFRTSRQLLAPGRQWSH